ncbi:Na(+)-translocating NADH-quinone reductase subunit C [Rheinheimera baltica]|uniref:Na(+)-translocating NADH-quinone reductase subunit C n=1 Tax=Rheinheimera baltica TaxID=67576 RepID=A0ABT9HZB1_9GAMM|nr:Na(+)-translocating NADH-quinone reductase subunit C [Rheinheimera baltica]MDP5136477.1 Na(+)-translocating NADH-quinone reductase subunit C [Rheinheimera baltica]MDP5151782.1 Na(+)-translocating NADH-quinone reductase subunit C [Rheinheimera baltica]MDP5190750.1 Na(+)-translocating NADH-quinone reductase subunit C [Rheinheimera baltica]
MSSNNDSISKTLIVVISLCLVCAVIVSTAAVQLRPQQTANKLLDSQKNVLAVTGLLSGSNINELYSKHIAERFVDLETGDLVDKPKDYDYRKAMKDPATSTRLAGEEDIASIKSRANIAPVYFAYENGVESGELSAIVLPIHGYGLWSTMHAFLALGADGSTIKGLNYYEQGETAGLGGEVQNPKWVAQFEGKKLLDKSGEPAIKVVKPGNASADSAFEVDGLSGATLTSNGVQHTFDFWAGAKGFAPFLTKVREGALNNG